MKRLKLFEEFNSDVILYRGDSSHVVEYEESKFDLKSLFGIGLYLTDDIEIADTYTIKGDDSAILFMTTIGSPYDIKYAEEIFICQYLIRKLDDSDFKYDKDYGWDDELNTLCDIKYKGISRYELSEYELSLDEEDQLKRTEWKTELKQKDDKILAKYNTRYNRAKSYFNTHRNDFKFIFKNDNGGDVDINIVDNTKKVGHISEFSVPIDVLNKCYDAESVIDDNIIKVLTKTALYNKKLNSKSLSYSQAIKKYNGYYSEKQDLSTLGKVFYKVGYYLSRDWTYETWLVFRKGMKKLGYTGIRYQGGAYAGNKHHNAYVIWDYKNLKRLK